MRDVYLVDYNIEIFLIKLKVWKVVWLYFINI